ncbi:hypothetical protein [Micrococcoides hystricis]|uniref:DUF308 domain-containing protein n=1 Tax=Micrococcoides hystricis TaxID=1572761 RepID=A0ABV6PBP4_9MICC
MAALPTDPALARALTRPVFLRALIAALFAIPTIFIFSLDNTYLRFGAAALFVLTASQIYDHVKVSTAHAPKASVPIQLPQLLAAIVLMLGGVGMLFVTTPQLEAIVIGGTLGIAGVAEVVAYFRGRSSFWPARDFLVIGIAHAGTGVFLLLANQLNEHGILGVLAGGMLIVAVFGLITTFGYRYEAKRETAESSTTAAGESTL